MLGNQRFPGRARLPAMCRGELSAVISRLMSKCLWSGREWLWGAKEMPPLPCIPVIRKCSWKENPDKKKKPLSIFFSFGIRFFTLQLHVVRDLTDVFVTSLLYTLVISLSCMHFLFCFVLLFSLYIFQICFESLHLKHIQVSVN